MEMGIGEKEKGGDGHRGERGSEGGRVCFLEDARDEFRKFREK